MTSPLLVPTWAVLRVKLITPLLLLTLFLSGCAKITLFSQLGELEANEMMAILLQRDIPCSKEPGKEEKWLLKVDSSDFARSVDILKGHGYPRDKFARMGDIFQKSGLVSSPTEERIRYMYALSQELSETIMRIDGVLNARVHIVIPDNDPLAAKVTPSSCAVFIRYRSGFDLESLAPQLKNLVMNSIVGLNHDNVSLVLVPAANGPFAPAPRLESGGSPWQSWGVLGLGVLLVGGLAWFFSRELKRR
ncbi:MAG: type secretion protein, partial [Verrucomicrobiota bacterium]